MAVSRSKERSCIGVRQLQVERGHVLAQTPVLLEGKRNKVTRTHDTEGRTVVELKVICIAIAIGKSLCDEKLKSVVHYSC